MPWCLTCGEYVSPEKPRTCSNLPHPRGDALVDLRARTKRRIAQHAMRESAWASRTWSPDGVAEFVARLADASMPLPYDYFLEFSADLKWGDEKSQKRDRLALSEWWGAMAASARRGEYPAS